MGRDGCIKECFVGVSLPYKLNGPFESIVYKADRVFNNTQAPSRNLVFKPVKYIRPHVSLLPFTSLIAAADLCETVVPAVCEAARMIGPINLMAGGIRIFHDEQTGKPRTLAVDVEKVPNLTEAHMFLREELADLTTDINYEFQPHVTVGHFFYDNEEQGDLMAEIPSLETIFTVNWRFAVKGVAIYSRPSRRNYTGILASFSTITRTRRTPNFRPQELLRLAV